MSESKLQTLILLVLGAAIFYVLDGSSIEPFCIVKRITGVPCPGCGTWRAASCLTHGEFGLALYHNPLATLGFLYLIVLFLSIVVDAVARTDCYRRLRYFSLSSWGYALIMAAVILNWLWNICKYGPAGI